MKGVFLIAFLATAALAQLIFDNRFNDIYVGSSTRAKCMLAQSDKYLDQGTCQGAWALFVMDAVNEASCLYHSQTLAQEKIRLDWMNIRFSPQHLLECCIQCRVKSDNGCLGGDVSKAFQFLNQTGLYRTDDRKTPLTDADIDTKYKLTTEEEGYMKASPKQACFEDYKFKSCDAGKSCEFSKTDSCPTTCKDNKTKVGDASFTLVSDLKSFYSNENEKGTIFIQGKETKSVDGATIDRSISSLFLVVQKHLNLDHSMWAKFFTVDTSEWRISSYLSTMELFTDIFDYTAEIAGTSAYTHLSGSSLGTFIVRVIAFHPTFPKTGSTEYNPPHSNGYLSVMVPFSNVGKNGLIYIRAGLYELGLGRTVWTVRFDDATKTLRTKVQIPAPTDM